MSTSEPEPEQARATAARFLRSQKDGVCLAIKIQPRSSRNEIVGLIGDELRIRVTAPPVDAAANEALLGLLSAQLGCARNAVQLVRGHTSRHKQIFVRGMTAERVLEKLPQIIRAS